MDLQASRATWASLIGLAMLGGCAANMGEVADEEGGDVSVGEEALRAPLQDVAFTEFEDPAGIGNAGRRETRLVITGARTYARLFGHAPPRGVDFGAGDGVVFYSAGLKPTGGYDTAILGIVRSGSQLGVTTQLVAPGKDCIVTDGLTTPHVLVKFEKPRRLSRVRFTRKDEVRDCGAAGGPACGGIAARPCPGSGRCVDDPSDSCDPQNGGADCGGICTCVENQLCVQGKVWDNSPDVCACVDESGDDNPCIATTCLQGSRCELQNGAPVCVSNGALACGSATCADGQVCCNPSCGICTQPDEACIEIFCEPKP